MSREVMKQALEALEKVIEAFGPGLTLQQRAITTLRQALETEQAMKDAIVGGTGMMLDGKRIDPATIYKEEPVAWRSTSPDGKLSNLFAGTSKEVNWTPIYTEPPKREWVGLTDEDEIPWDGVDAKSFARAIEAKLKEKNA